MLSHDSMDFRTSVIPIPFPLLLPHHADWMASSGLGMLALTSASTGAMAAAWAIEATPSGRRRRWSGRPVRPARQQPGSRNAPSQLRADAASRSPGPRIGSAGLWCHSSGPACWLRGARPVGVSTPSRSRTPLRRSFVPTPRVEDPQRILDGRGLVAAVPGRGLVIADQVGGSPAATDSDVRPAVVGKDLAEVGKVGAGVRIVGGDVRRVVARSMAQRPALPFTCSG